MMNRQLTYGQARYLILIFICCVLISLGIHYPLTTQYHWVDVSEIQNGKVAVTNGELISNYRGMIPRKVEVCTEYTLLGKSKCTIVRLK